MNISRFFGSTNREAMRQVRMALGSEALIVSNRRVNGGVEILAADATQVAGDAPIPVALATAATRTAPLAAEHPAGLMDAIAALRGDLEHRMQDLLWNQKLQQAPQALPLFQTLLGLGFSTVLLKSLFKGLPSGLSETAARQWARQELIAQVPTCADEDALWRPGLALALVGPTGVGKTTTLAKLAARAVRRFGPQRVALLTTDTYRIGACEQLNIYGQILRTPVHVAHDAQQLQRIVRSLCADHVLLIDNVGVSQRDSAVKAQAAMLRAAGREVQRLLVLNAASHGDTLEEVAHTYRHDGGGPLVGCILSKLDEALRLAPALDTAIRHQLPIHYVSNGQKVPEHLSRSSAQDLVDKALASSCGHTLYAPNRADLTALMTLADETAAQDQARRLSGLLALSHPAGQALVPDVARQACDEIDAHSACARAFQMWRTHRLGQTPTHGQDAATPGAVGECLQSSPPVCMVAMHNQATVTLVREGQGRLHWSCVGSLSDDGCLQPLSSPLQVLQQANAWVSSCGASALGGLDAAQARLRQVQWFQTQASDIPTLHVFEGGTPRLWWQLEDMQVSWAAACAPGAAVIHEDTATRAGALANHAAYYALDTSGWHHSLQTCANRPLAQLTVWFAADVVTLRPRGKGQGQGQGQTRTNARLIHLRLQDHRDGSLIRQWSVLSHIRHPELTDAALAQILITRHAQQSMARTVQAFWQHCAAPDATQLGQDAQPGASWQNPWNHQAALAVHMALAAWYVQQSGHVASARRALTFLCAGAKPTVNGVASGLLRLFALKDMLRGRG